MVYIIIVSHGHDDYIENLLLNLKLPSGRFKIIVRDNKSSMVLKKTCEKNCVTYLHGGQYGFGHNNNIAVSYIINNFMIMNNDYFLFLNPDVFITSESLINYVDYIISNDYKFSTLCLYRDFTKSKHDYSIRSFPTLYDFLCSFLLGVNKSKIKKENILSDTVVDWCAGSFMLIHALSFLILDEAANKGTGKWTSQSALDLGEPLSLITESVFARYISSLKDQRVAASKVLSGPQAQRAGDKAEFIEKVRRALYLGKIVSYAQGFSQLRAASEEYNWDLNYGEIAKIFRAGCIIRAQFLQKITDAYAENPQIANLLLAPYFKQIADDYQQALRDVVAYAVQNGIPVPTFAAAVAYYDSYRAAVLPANLIQAQRDYFGAHTYKRIDKEGVFHTEWLD